MSQASTTHPEEKYQAELLSTEVGRRTAKVMTWVFVALLFSVPVLQTSVEISRGRVPQILELLRSVGTTGLSHDFTRNFEQSLEKASILKTWVQPRLQALLTAQVRAGNDKVLVGRNGWLFYQPGVNYVTGPDVTDAAFLAQAAKKSIDRQRDSDPHPDSRAALLALHRDSVAAGIHLVLVPIPDKVMLQPGQLTARLAGDLGVPPPNNRGYSRLIADLRREGVDVFEATPGAVDPRAVLYLAQDTHWTPGFMDQVAAGVARHIEPLTSAASADGRRFRLIAQPASRVGDLADLLMLPKNQRLFQPQSATVQQVVDNRTGAPWERNPAADVLLLGDSFTNIYSQPAMGWGSAAGFAEHVSYHLGRPIDVVAINGGGSSAVREELARRAAETSTPFPARVIVYEFTMHDLMTGDWPVIPFKPSPELMAAAAAQPSPAPEVTAPGARAPVKETPRAAPPAAGPLSVIARVVQTSKVPAPGSAPYKDCLTYVKLRIEQVESGKLSSQEVIGAFWAMKDDKWLPAASYAVGDRLRLTMIPMDRADRQIQALQRADDLDDFVLKVFFVTQEAIQ